MVYLGDLILFALSYYFFNITFRSSWLKIRGLSGRITQDLDECARGVLLLVIPPHMILSKTVWILPEQIRFEKKKL
jgi:hypothetical protein